MKRIIDISEDLYEKIMGHRALTKYQEHIDYEDLKNMVEDSTPVNECEVGDLLPKYINALRKCAKEHEIDFVPTFNIRTSDLCNDTAKLLEQIHQQRNIFAYANDMEVSVEELRVGCEAEDCISRKDTCDAIIKRLGIKDESFLLEAERVIYQQILAMPSVYPIG